MSLRILVIGLVLLCSQAWSMRPQDQVAQDAERTASTRTVGVNDGLALLLEAAEIVAPPLPTAAETSLDIRGVLYHVARFTHLYPSFPLSPCLRHEVYKVLLGSSFCNHVEENATLGYLSSFLLPQDRLSLAQGPACALSRATYWHEWTKGAQSHLFPVLAARVDLNRGFAAIRPKFQGNPLWAQVVGFLDKINETFYYHTTSFFFPDRGVPAESLGAKEWVQGIETLLTTLEHHMEPLTLMEAVELVRIFPFCPARLSYQQGPLHHWKSFIRRLNKLKAAHPEVLVSAIAPLISALIDCRYLSLGKSGRSPLSDFLTFLPSLIQHPISIAHLDWSQLVPRLLIAPSPSPQENDAREERFEEPRCGTPTSLKRAQVTPLSPSKRANRSMREE